MYSTMKPGDLVRHVEDIHSYGLILRVIDDVEIPPLIEVLWCGSKNAITMVYADDLIIVNKNVKDNATVI